MTQNVHGESTSVTAYYVWRGTQPYFDIEDSGCNCSEVDATPNLNWGDDGFVGGITPVGDIATNYFYVVEAANVVGRSAHSNRVGEFDFSLVPGTP